MHEGQYCKKSGEPYIMHPLAVANMFVDDTYASDGIVNIDTDCAIVAILHDAIEDTDLSIDALRLDYNPSDDIINALIAITRNNDEPYLDYILRCKRNRIAKKVKIEDILHNLSSLEKGNMRDNYIMTLYILDI